MEGTDRGNFLEGEVLFIDKPLTWTSFDVVNKIRQSLRQYLGIRKIKVGHAGTLDPLATGLVIICTGKATKQIACYQELDKKYRASMKLGETTPSYDLETNVDRTFPWEHITLESVKRVLGDYVGDLHQIPPRYSAKSVEGKRAYQMARKGMEVELKPQPVTIHSINILEFDPPFLSLEVVCSKGTYIRSLARDIGIQLKSGAHLTGLRRTMIGPHPVENAISIEEFVKRLELL